MSPHPTVRLRLTEAQHSQLYKHLFPGDGLEAVALVLCGVLRTTRRFVLCAHKLYPVPYVQCSERTPNSVTWNTSMLPELLHEADQNQWALLKVHSHPGGLREFSSTDDRSDEEILGAAESWVERGGPHASAIMLPSGELVARVSWGHGRWVPIDSVMITGFDVTIWPRQGQSSVIPETARRHAQAFGAGTTALLRQLEIAVVGCSGTGSPVIEQLARLGVGRLVLVDPDLVEEKNLNRIYNSTRADAIGGRPKAEVLAQAVRNMGLGTDVDPMASSLLDPAVVREVAGCDLVFGCMDSIEGRHVLNHLARHYSMPYLDLGVKLEADGRGGIEAAAGAVRYLRPDGATLMDWGVYTPQRLEAEELRRTDPDLYRDRVKRGYLRGVPEERPAVISVNTLVASLAVNELLARVHHFRLDSNEGAGSLLYNFMSASLSSEPEPTQSGIWMDDVGRGDRIPLLGLLGLTDLRSAS